MKRWGTMLEPADVTRQFLETIIHIIGRKTSEEYAAVTVRTLLKKLYLKYTFIREMEIKDTRFMELESSVRVGESLNSIDPKEIGNALKDLIKMIMSSIGKTAGYFFIRELREKIGTDSNEMLLKTMGVDLTLMQSTYIVEKKSINLLQIEKSDLVRRFLKTLLDLVERQTSKTVALEIIARRIDTVRQQYPFLEGVTIMDIRYTLGADEISVQRNINDVDSKELGKALQSVLNETDAAMVDQGLISVVSDLQTHLTAEYLLKLEELGVKLTTHGVGYDTLLRQIITTVIDLLGKASSEAYAIYVANTVLQKINRSSKVLHVTVNPTKTQNGIYQISMPTNLPISETDARRAIQKLLEEIVSSLGETPGNEFIQTFKNALDKKYLLRIEEIGVNIHMIELHQELTAQAG